jgi:hypothetical protein
LADAASLERRIRFIENEMEFLANHEINVNGSMCEGSRENGFEDGRHQI